MPPSIDLEELYDNHSQALFAFLLNLTRNEADARDLLQEIFIKLARQPRLLDDVREVRPFLIRLVHNMAVDLMRRRGTREKYYERLAGSISIFAVSTEPDEQIFRESVTEALQELPPEQCAVVHLKLWEGLTFETIADALGIPERKLRSNRPPLANERIFAPRLDG